MENTKDIRSHQIGYIHQEVWQRVGQKGEEPGDQGQSQTPAALLSRLSMAEDSGSGEGGSPSEQEELIPLILVLSCGREQMISPYLERYPPTFQIAKLTPG